MKKTITVIIFTTLCAFSLFKTKSYQLFENPEAYTYSEYELTPYMGVINVPDGWVFEETIGNALAPTWLINNKWAGIKVELIVSATSILHSSPEDYVMERVQEIESTAKVLAKCEKSNVAPSHYSMCLTYINKGLKVESHLVWSNDLDTAYMISYHAHEYVWDKYRVVLDNAQPIMPYRVDAIHIINEHLKTMS